MSGVVQLCECSGRPEGEIIYMAPSLSAHPEARHIWSQLLSQVCKQAGEQGLQRINSFLNGRANILYLMAIKMSCL